MTDERVRQLAARVGQEFRSISRDIENLSARLSAVAGSIPGSGVEPHGSSHRTGGADPISITIEQVEGLAARLRSTAGGIPDSFVFVESVADFPNATGDVITLVDGVCYFVTRPVDLGGKRLVAGQNTTIMGSSYYSCSISSTGLAAGTALLASAWNLHLASISITHGTAVNLDATGNAGQALDFQGVNFEDCATIGTIKNYDNVLLTNCGILESAGLTLDGTISTFAADKCLFNPPASGTAIVLPSSVTISRRFRVIYSSFVVGSGETGINASASATIPTEGYILDTVNFSGAGTYISGLTHTDDESLFVNCRGITNTAVAAGMTMSNNATATNIVTTGVAVKVAGTTTAAPENQKFTHSDNKLTYTGALPRVFRISVILTVTGPNNAQITASIYDIGSQVSGSAFTVTTDGSGRAENIITQAIVSMDATDYIEVYISNDTNNTDVTVEDMSVIVDWLN